MSGYYIYLISSLPMLNLGMKPPFSGERFLAICQRLISGEDLEVLKKATLNGASLSPAIHPTLEKWRVFDTALRNELVKIRASHKHIDPLKYLRQDGYAQTYITHIALSAHRNPSVLEGEKILDEARWAFLDSLSLGHYFDLDFLLIYALKLLLLERWHKINTADKRAVLEEILVKN